MKILVKKTDNNQQISNLQHFGLTLLFCCFFGLFSLSFTTIKTTTIDAEKLTILESCPKASFDATQNSETIPEVQFNNKSTGAISYVWDFGDGQTSTLAHPQHTYSASGTYTVQLIAIGASCSSEFIGVVEIIGN